jgi:hypothetical protein
MFLIRVPSLKIWLNTEQITRIVPNADPNSGITIYLSDGHVVLATQEDWRFLSKSGPFPEEP